MVIGALHATLLSFQEGFNPEKLSEKQDGSPIPPAPDRAAELLFRQPLRFEVGLVASQTFFFILGPIVVSDCRAQVCAKEGN